MHFQRWAAMVLLVGLSLGAVWAQEGRVRIAVVSLREILKQVPVQNLAPFCRTNDWGEAYSRINTRIIELSRKMEEPVGEKLLPALRDQRYQLENERTTLENNIRNIAENVIRQFLSEEFGSAFPVILNKDDPFEIIFSGMEVADITNVAVARLRVRQVEKTIPLK